MGEKESQEEQQEDIEDRRCSSLLTWTGDVSVTDHGAFSISLTRLAPVAGGGVSACPG